MPVVVTGADEPLGRGVVDALTGRGYDLRATVRYGGPVAELVGLGVKTATWDDGDDVSRLGAVLEGAHTVVHVRGGARDTLFTLGDVLDAAEDSGVRRIVTLAPLDRTDQELERLRHSGYDAVVFLVGAVDVGGLLDVAVRRYRTLVTIPTDELVAKLVAADEARDVGGYREEPAVGGRVIAAPIWRRILRPGPDLLG
jgi:hypothetical protein